MHPLVGAAPFGDKSATCHPSGLHLATNSLFLKPKETRMQTAVIKKTRATAMTLCYLVLSATVFDAQAVSIRGGASCGVWIKERQEKGWPLVAKQNWLMGYLSGLAVENGKDFLRTTDAESIFLWVDNYCRANPLKDIDDAGFDLSRELIKQKKL